MADQPLESLSTSNGFSSLQVNLIGGQLLSWQTKDDHDELKEVLYQGSKVNRTGIPVLFPFADPLKNGEFKLTGWKIPRHGFARDCTWSLDNLTEDVLSVCLSSEDLNDELKQAYPFNFNLILYFDISEKNTLNLYLKVTNLDEKIMPIAPGFHPYFPIQNIDKNNLIIGGLKGFENKLIPQSTDSDGIYYAWDNPIKAYFPSGKEIEITDKTESDNVFENIVVWSQSEANVDCDFVCIEQFTRGLNGINDDPILIDPGEEWIGKISYKVL
jgi:galactose mutarotase-like enzyme